MPQGDSVLGVPLVVRQGLVKATGFLPDQFRGPWPVGAGQKGRYQRVLLALEVVNKKWQKAKRRHLELAERRLADWLARGGPRAR